MNEFTTPLPQWLLRRRPLVSLSNNTHLWFYKAVRMYKPQVTFCRWIQVIKTYCGVNRGNNTWHDNLSDVRVCHQSCEIISSRDVWNCSSAVLRLRAPVIIRLLSVVTVEIIPQSLHESILAVWHKPLLSNWTKWQVWLQHWAGATGRDDSVFLWPPLDSSGNKKLFFFSHFFEKTHGFVPVNY